MNTHLWWVISSTLWFMVDSTNQLVLLKSVDKGDNWTTVTTRTHKIQSGWNDGTYIWLVDCDNDGTADDFDVWKITVDGNDTITSIGTSAGAVANTVYARDIFKIGANVYVIDAEDTDWYVVWDVDTAPFVKKDDQASFNGNNCFLGAVVGNNYYTLVTVPTVPVGVRILTYDDTGPSLDLGVTHLEDHTFPADRNIEGISYDGSDLLYFILTKDSDGKEHLITYSITGDSYTELSEYNISLMLDRNCSNTVPNELEKAFDIAKDANNLSRIYQIKPRKGGLIQLQSIILAQNIIAITDNFLMFANGAMYEYTDILATNTIAEGKVNKGIFPILEKGNFNCHPQDAHLFYNDDSIKVYDASDNMVLFAKIENKSRDENGISVFGLDAYNNELWRRSYVKTHTTVTTHEKQQDNIDNACGFCHRDSSIVATTTDYSYEQDRPPMAMFSLGRFMERQVGYTQPNGKVWTKAYDGLAASGLTWNVETDGELDLINIGRDKPSYYVKKLGITRTTCVGAAGISQTYAVASLEDGKTIVPLKEYRDMKIQANTEALQLATAAYNMFALETEFIGLRAVNKGYLPPGQTVIFSNTGDITISSAARMILFYTYDWVNDVYDLLILTNNVVLLREFESYFDRSNLMTHQNSTAVRENATDVGTNAAAIAALEAEGAPLIYPFFTFGAGGFVESGGYGACLLVAFSDVNANINLSFWVHDGGNFKIRILHGGTQNNAGKTIGGIYYISYDVDGGTQTWDAGPIDINLPAANANVLGVDDSAVAYTIASNSKVGVYYAKDDNAGGAAGNMEVYGLVLIRQ